MQAYNMQSIDEIQTELNQDMLQTIGTISNLVTKELQRSKSGTRTQTNEPNLRNVRVDSRSPTRKPDTDDKTLVSQLKR
jgi:hypothetical protein